MTYASGGTIQASDFNNLNGASAGTQGGGTQLNPVWSTGFGNYGYGQTAISNVSVGGTVAATDWATLINRLNSSRIHQSGSGSGISAPIASANITFLPTLSSAISTAATNRLSAYSIGTSSSLNKAFGLSAGAGTAVTGSTTFTITFGSVDAARYFFNAGGNIFIAYSAFTNTGGTSRGTSIQTMAQTNFTSKRLGGTNFSSRTGAGGTVIVDDTTGGYYGLSTSPVTEFLLNSTSYYSGDYFLINYSTNGTAGSYGANGNVLTITVVAFSAATGSTQPPDSINVTLTMNCSLQLPENINLSNSWGTPTIT